MLSQGFISSFDCGHELAVPKRHLGGLSRHRGDFMISAHGSPVHRRFTDRSRILHTKFTRGSHTVHIRFTQSSSTVHRPFTGPSPVHGPFTGSRTLQQFTDGSRTGSPTVRRRFTSGSPIFHGDFTNVSQSVHRRFTGPSQIHTLFKLASSSLKS